VAGSVLCRWLSKQGNVWDRVIRNKHLGGRPVASGLCMRSHSRGQWLARVAPVAVHFVRYYSFVYVSSDLCKQAAFGGSAAKLDSREKATISQTSCKSLGGRYFKVDDVQGVFRLPDQSLCPPGSECFLVYWASILHACRDETEMVWLPNTIPQQRVSRASAA